MPHTPEEFTREEASLARHRAALRQRFTMPPSPARTPRRRGPLIVAGMVAALGALLWADPAFHTQRYATAAGARQQIDLSDGTAVTLNTRTVAEVEWHLRSRQVRLVEGEALFDVARAWQPFIVRAGGTKVRVVGTAFNVRRADPRVTVTVLRGRVHVEDASGDAVLLGPRQAADTGAGTLNAHTAPDPAAAVAWKDGKLLFDHTPLAQAVADINRYRVAPVTLADPALERLQISGVFDNARTDTLLDLLPSILPVTIRREADDAIRVLARNVPR
ncbi:FecR family protein [Ralstonia solanacearum]|uniref:FecR family protein n=1 Tax=Ralstonia solanacearum TaxID=305 RepID=A0AAE3NJD9_RALSL|nr:FecR family protein [Ralstonia solanacearum]KFX27206.1 iron dicitrate transport regulator FecR [Ralstonia solanacearum]MBB6580945.1 FecR family protein [Ralstonia solanacearum]MDB0524312.1 FecR family protein [Ralstonia solanacearum]